MKVANTYFYKKKQQKWTWRSPNGEMFNEIDYILANNNITVDDVQVLNQVSLGSDHRLVRAKIQTNTKVARSKLIKSNCQTCNTVKLKEHAVEYNLELANRFNRLASAESDLECLGLDELTQILTDEITEASQKIARKSRMPTKNN